MKKLTRKKQGKAKKEDENDVNNDDEDDRQAGRNRNAIKNKFAMTFRDVEDSIWPFSEDKKYLVEQWITDLIETADLPG